MRWMRKIAAVSFEKFACSAIFTEWFFFLKVIHSIENIMESLQFYTDIFLPIFEFTFSKVIEIVLILFKKP